MVEAAVIGCLALALFGTGFNRLVAALEKRGYLEGFTWLAVTAGVGVTVAVMAMASWGWYMTGWQWGLWMLAGFASSGMPMALGAVERYVRRRRSEQETLRRITTKDYFQ